MKKLKRILHLWKNRVKVLFRNLAIKVLTKLSEWGLVYHHKNAWTDCNDDGKVHSSPDISSDRYTFSVSYILRQFETKREEWFTTNQGKLLLMVEDYHHTDFRIEYRADLKAFLAHFSPRQKMWVYRHSPVVSLHYDFQELSLDFDKMVTFKTHHCDFTKCRYAYTFSYAPDLDTGKVPLEVLAESQIALKRGLTSKVSEINKILTGADYDGELMSPKKMPLSENILCRKCGFPVFASAENKYHFECLHHGELDYEWVKRVDPVEYQSVLRNTFDILESLIQKSCPQD